MPEMGVYEAMRTLKAVRRLKPDPIPDDVLHKLPTTDLRFRVEPIFVYRAAGVRPKG